MSYRPLNQFSLVLVFLLIGSSNPVAIKYALNHGWPPFILGLSRMMLIGFFFGIWACFLRENIIGPNREARYHTVIASLCKGAGAICFYVALSYIPANRAVMLSTISPIANLLLIHMLLEQDAVRKKHILGVAVSFLGISILLSHRETGTWANFTGGGNVFLGDFAMLAGVIFHNTMVIFEKKALNAGGNPRQLLHATNIVSVLVFSFFFMLSGEHISDIPMTTPSIWAFIYLVTIAGIILFYYRRWLVSKLEVSYINSFSHAGKVVAVFYAALLLGETISLLSVVCFGVILSGTYMATRAEKTSKLDFVEAS